MDTRHRDMMRMYRKARKLAYEIRGPWRKPEKREKSEKQKKQVYRAYITLEDRVGVHHLRHRVGRREEFQTNLTHPHEFRKTLVRVFRLKNLQWTLYHVDKEGNRARMPQLIQVIEDEAEYVLDIERQKKKRTNAPGTSKRKHFERANQKKRRGDFEWHPPQSKESHKNDPPRPRRHEEGDSKRFTWTAPDTEPHVEPPRPEGRKPLILTPQKVRKICDQRLEEWSKDQEEYAEKQFQEVQKKLQEQKEPRTKGAVDPGSDRKAVSEEEERRAVAEKEALVRIDKRYEDVLFTIQRKAMEVDEQREAIEKRVPFTREEHESLVKKRKELETREQEIKEEQGKLRTLKDLEKRKVQDLTQEELQARIKAEDERVQAIRQKELEAAREEDRRRIEKVTEEQRRYERYKEDMERRIAKEREQERKEAEEKRAAEARTQEEERRKAAENQRVERLIERQREEGRTRNAINDKYRGVFGPLYKRRVEIDEKLKTLKKYNWDKEGIRQLEKEKAQIIDEERKHLATKEAEIETAIQQLKRKREEEDKT
jgi:hypothetical protein